jgi:hypothetical protein
MPPAAIKSAAGKIFFPGAGCLQGVHHDGTVAGGHGKGGGVNGTTVPG